MFRPLRRLLTCAAACTAALVATSSPSEEAVVELAYEPTGLAWSATEVELAAAASVRNLVEQAPRPGACRAACARVQRIYARLLPVARQQTRRSRHLPWSLTVLDAPQVEAMALPGGQVLVSEQFVESGGYGDEALAFVLAHEMAHSILEHERQALTFARMLLPRDVPRSVGDMYVEIDHNFALLKSMEPVMQQGELEADELGLLLASAAGFAPRAQLAFMEHEAARDDGEKALVGTHPPASVRLAQLRARLPLAERLHAMAKAGP
jgi:predicted Zn-dependent protease